jgi:hypothetical protein
MDMVPGSLPAGVASAADRERAVGPDTRAVVLVEGLSDRVALEVLADRRGLDLGALGVVVVPTGGATAVRACAEQYARRGVRLAGLYDAGEERAVARALERAGLGVALDRPALERLGFFACVDDLEDELIRALGLDAVEAVLERQGELTSFRRLQRQPAQRERTSAEQLHRFMGTRSGRKWRYAALLTDALDLAAVPAPLTGVLVSATS